MYIQTDLADRFGQVYSDGFGRPILTGMFRRIRLTDLDNSIQTDLDKYILIDLGDGFGQVQWKLSIAYTIGSLK